MAVSILSASIYGHNLIFALFRRANMEYHICPPPSGKYEMSGRIWKQIWKQPCINLFIARLNPQSAETLVKRVINSFTTSFARGVIRIPALLLYLI